MDKMQKIMLIGSPGSGKSTLARKIAEKTGLPVFHLDMIWHKPDKTNIPREEFDAIQREICAGDRWLIDGNYNRTLEIRMEKCDTIVLLDYPVEICLEGAAARVGKERPDMPWQETELDGEFKKFIEDFPQTSLPRICELIEKHRSHCKVFVLKSRKDADEFLSKIE